jgi:EpsI family protein
VLLSVSLPSTGLWLSSRSARPLAFPLARLDPVEAVWARTADEPLAPEVLAQVRPDAYVHRGYVDPEGSPIWLYLGLYSGLGSEGAHNPEVCYPAQGWEVIEARSTWIPVGERDRFRARLVRVGQGSRTEWVLWWFQPVGRWTLGDAAEQLMRVYDGVRGRAQYGFVRLSTPALEGERAQEALVRFAAALAPRVREVVEHAERPGGPDPRGLARLRR